ALISALLQMSCSLVPAAARPVFAVLLFQSYPDRRTLHSFPTRRSSDLHRPRPHRPTHPRPTTRIHQHPPQPGRLRTRHRHPPPQDRKSTRLNSSHVKISYAVFCLKKKRTKRETTYQCPNTPTMTRPEHH